MRAQQERLLEERGDDADYYLNDLFGLEGVDLTKGVLPSSNNYQDNSGGYRDGVTENDYLDEVGAKWEDGEKSDENKGIEISFVPSDALKNKQYTFTYSVNADLSDGKTINTSNTSVTLKNLLVNQKYYFKVAAEGEESEVLDFTTGDYPRWIDARPMFNVRDMGGWTGLKGYPLKYGTIVRGSRLNVNSSTTKIITQDGINELRRVGMRAELDIHRIKEVLLKKSSLQFVSAHGCTIKCAFQSIHGYLFDGKMRPKSLDELL